MKLFEAGHVNTPLPPSYRDVQFYPHAESVTIEYPSRLEAMALDPSRLDLRPDMKYAAGQVDICVDATRTIEVSTGDSGVEIVGATEKPALVRHAALIMKEVLGYDGGLKVDLQEDEIPRHCGFGSSSSTIAGVATAINELFGRPVRPLDLARFTAQNHGEEVDGSSDLLTPVQCIGGSAVCGLFEGSLVILSGESTPVYRGNLPASSTVVVGVPADFEHPDSQQLMQDELDNMDGFRNTGEQHGNTIAYRMLHEALPGLIDNDFAPLKQLVFDYRWRMGSIDNCSFVYPPMKEVAAMLAHHETEPTTDLVALSSVGPGFFAVTSRPGDVVEEFESLGMNTYKLRPWSGTYKVKGDGHDN